MDIGLNKYDDYKVQVVAPTGAATLGQGFTVETLVSQQQVDPTGVVVQVAVPAVSAQLTSDPSVSITTANPATTGADGVASWSVSCTVAGSFTAQVSTPNGSGSASLPACQNPSSTTTTEPPPTVLNLPVGGSFTVPAGGPYPSGVYATTRAGCAVTFQVYQEGVWLPGSSVGLDLVLAGPARNFVASPGAPNCTYTRRS